MQQPSEEALLEAVSKLVAIESTANNPAELHAAYGYLRELVLSELPDITIEEFDQNGKPSLLAYRGGQRPDKFHIILNAHLDVVPGKPEQFRMTTEGNKISGRGVYDMKAAAVVLASIFCEYVDTVPYRLALQIVTDEESTGKDGTLHQIQQGVRADFVICGESGRALGKYEIATEAKGIVAAEVALSGNSAHAAYPWKGDNAAAKAAEFVQAVHSRYPIPLEESNGTTMTVTSIIADGGSANRTADVARIKINARYIAGDPNFASPASFAAHIKSLDPRAEITQFTEFSAPVYTDPANPLLLELKAAAEAVEGAPFTFVRRHATSDGRFYGAFGNQTCEFGIAGEGQHADDEHITIDAFQNYLNTMRAFLDRTRTSESARRDEALTAR